MRCVKMFGRWEGELYLRMRELYGMIEVGRGIVFENERIVWYDIYKEVRWEIVICEGLWMSERKCFGNVLRREKRMMEKEVKGVDII